MPDIGHWLTSMNSAQQWMLVVLLLLILGRFFHALSSSEGPVEALLNLGGPAVLAAAAGGLRVLTAQAGILQEVSAIPPGHVISGGQHLNVERLGELGDNLFVDAICVYVVFLLVVAMIFFERQVAARARKNVGVTLPALVRSISLGYVLPAFIGFFALYLIYTTS
jgi:hypothetical protein